MNILFTCAGRRNYLINYFKEALKGQGKIFASDMQLSAPALVDADVAIEVPGIYDESYISTIKQIVTDNQIDAIISLNDLELPILAAHKAEIEKLGAKVIVSDEQGINVAADKWLTVNFLLENGLKTPKTFIDLDAAMEAIASGELKFPLVLKPRWGSGSIGIDFPEDVDELKIAYKLQLIKIGRSILGRMSQQDLSHSILIQQKMPGKEYGMDVLNDFSGKYMGTFVREKLSMRSGETDKAISIIRQDFEVLGAKLGQSFKHIGNLDCDVFEHEGDLYVLELNPRFGGGYPFSHEAGMNTAATYIEWLSGGHDTQQFNNYKAGILFSKCDRLLKIKN